LLISTCVNFHLLKTIDSGQSYAPSFEEVGITLFLVLVSVLAFKIIVENFQVFEEEINNHVEVSKEEVETESIVFNK
jgi:hypothetical protein